MWHYIGRGGYGLLFIVKFKDEDGELAVEEGEFQGGQIVVIGRRVGTQEEGLQSRGPRNRVGQRLQVFQL